MFYRALHIVSSSRYRLPVRKFVFDLFDIPLDQEHVQQLNECARTLALSQVKTPTSSGRRRAMSVLFAAPKAHPSGSDEEDDAAVATHRPGAKKSNAPPVMCLQPKTTIKGFNSDSDDSL